MTRSLCLTLRTIFVAAAFAVLGVTFTPTTLRAALPVVERIEPLGVVRGETTTLTFRGRRLGDAHQVVADLPGIEIVSVEPVDDKEVKVAIKTASDLAPGLYPVRLVTRSGVANLRLIGVGAMPVISEAEPNNDFQRPQDVPMDRTIHGVIEREDVDYFRVKLAKGQRLAVEVEGIRLVYTLVNRSIFDPFIAILDSNRFEVASSDDSSLLRQDGVCSFTAPADGEYTIAVRDSSFGGAATAGYRLHVGSFPRPTTVIPTAAAKDSVVPVKVIDVDGSVRTTELRVPPSDRLVDHPVPTVVDGKHAPSPNRIRVGDLPIRIEQEPNDDYRKAPMTTVPAAFCGVLQEPGDFDCFAFELKKGQRFRVESFARRTLRSPVDPVINVYGPDNRALQSSDDASGVPDSFLEFTAKADGKHTLRIYDHLRGGSDRHNYRVEVTPATPDLAITLRELRRYEARVVDIPRGGRAAVVVRATRRGFNEELRFRLDGLPDGVTAETFPMPKGRSEIPILLTAAADAKHNASLFDVTGIATVGKTEVRGGLSQIHNLVLGQNRRILWSHRTERAAAAVTDPVPFTIELVQPETPIVRRGSKNLLVRIKRDDGFKGKVSLTALYNPPGIGINNSRSIAADKTTVTVPITANGGAAIGQWPVIFNARYTSSTGTAYTVTNAIMLVVQNELFKYDFPRSTAETDSDQTLTFDLEFLRESDHLKGPDRDVSVQLVGLPRGVTCADASVPIGTDAETVAFPIHVASDAKLGRHKTLNLITRVKVGEETIVQTSGPGELRVVRPVPPETLDPSAGKSAASENSANRNSAKQDPGESARPKPAPAPGDKAAATRITPRPRAGRSSDPMPYGTTT